MAISVKSINQVSGDRDYSFAKLKLRRKHERVNNKIFM